MKAYKITCADEDHGHEIVFADNPVGARRQHSREICDCEFIEIRIRRARDFDDLSPGPMTISDYLSRGWQYPCGNCERHLYQDDEPVIVADRAYCNIECITKLREHYREYDGKDAHESIKSLCRELDARLVGSLGYSGGGQMISGWRYYWRRYLGWVLVQFCMICGKPYWGGFPYPSLDAWKLGYFWQWMPWYSDYCSEACADIDLDSLP